MAAKKVEQKKEFKMEQVFAMWKHTSKAGKQYFTGKYQDTNLVGFYNTNKKNPKEPDIRIYKTDEEGEAEKEEFLSLWCNVSKNEKKYLSGKLGNKKIVGFITENPRAKQPSFSLYYSNEEPKKVEAGKEEFMKIPDNEEPLPF